MNRKSPHAATAPEWFVTALRTPPTIFRTPADGAEICYRQWGDGAGVPIVLIHGGGAHSRWWDHIAPHLASGRRVIALDLSGHGDSGHRASYGVERWAADVRAVMQAELRGVRPLVVGHSLGGIVALEVARSSDVSLAGVVIVDSPFGDETSGADIPAHRSSSDAIAGRAPRLYAGEADAIARFKPIPIQSMLPFIAEHIAQTSVIEVPGGWTWKFDRSMFHESGAWAASLKAVPCAVTVFAAQHGILTSGMKDTIRSFADRGVSLVDIADAGHAPMLDQPLALIDGIRSVLDRVSAADPSAV